MEEKIADEQWRRKEVDEDKIEPPLARQAARARSPNEE